MAATNRRWKITKIGGGKHELNSGIPTFLVVSVFICSADGGADWSWSGVVSLVRSFGVHRVCCMRKRWMNRDIDQYRSHRDHWFFWQIVRYQWGRTGCHTHALLFVGHLVVGMSEFFSVNSASVECWKKHVFKLPRDDRITAIHDNYYMLIHNRLTKIILNYSKISTTLWRGLWSLNILWLTGLCVHTSWQFMVTTHTVLDHSNKIQHQFQNPASRFVDSMHMQSKTRTTTTTNAIIRVNSAVKSERATYHTHTSTQEWNACVSSASLHICCHSL